MHIWGREWLTQQNQSTFSHLKFFYAGSYSDRGRFVATDATNPSLSVQEEPLPLGPPSGLVVQEPGGGEGFKPFVTKEKPDAGGAMHANEADASNAGTKSSKIPEKDRIFDEAVCREGGQYNGKLTNAVLRQTRALNDAQMQQIFREVSSPKNVGSDNDALITLIEKGERRVQDALADPDLAKKTKWHKRFGWFGDKTARLEAYEYQALDAALTNTVMKYEAAIAAEPEKKRYEAHLAELEKYYAELETYNKSKTPGAIATSAQRPVLPPPFVAQGIDGKEIEGVDSESVHNLRQAIAYFRSKSKLVNIVEEARKRGAAYTPGGTEHDDFIDAVYRGEDKGTEGSRTARQADGYNNSTAPYAKLKSQKALEEQIKDYDKKIVDCRGIFESEKQSGNAQQAVVTEAQLKQLIIDKEGLEQKLLIEKKLIEQKLLASYKNIRKPLERGSIDPDAVDNRGFGNIVLGKFWPSRSGKQNIDYYKTGTGGVSLTHSKGIRIKISDDNAGAEITFGWINPRNIELGLPGAMSKLTEQLMEVHALDISIGRGGDKDNPVMLGNMDPPQGDAMQFSAVLGLAEEQTDDLYVSFNGTTYRVPPDAINMTEDALKNTFTNPDPAATDKDKGASLWDFMKACERKLTHPTTKTLQQSRFLDKMTIEIFEDIPPKGPQSRKVNIRKLAAELGIPELTLFAKANKGGIIERKDGTLVQVFTPHNSRGLKTFFGNIFPLDLRHSIFKNEDKIGAIREKLAQSLGDPFEETPEGKNLLGELAGKQAKYQKNVKKLQELLKKIEQSYGQKDIKKFNKLYNEVIGSEKIDQAIIDGRTQSPNGLLVPIKNKLADTYKDTIGNCEIEALNTKIELAKFDYADAQKDTDTLDKSLDGGCKLIEHKTEALKHFKDKNPDEKKEITQRETQVKGLVETFEMMKSDFREYLQRTQAMHEAQAECLKTNKFDEFKQAETLFSEAKDRWGITRAVFDAMRQYVEWEKEIFELENPPLNPGGQAIILSDQDKERLEIGNHLVQASSEEVRALLAYRENPNDDSLQTAAEGATKNRVIIESYYEAFVKRYFGNNDQEDTSPETQNALVQAKKLYDASMQKKAAQAERQKQLDLAAKRPGGGPPQGKRFPAPRTSSFSSLSSELGGFSSTDLEDENVDPSSRRCDLRSSSSFGNVSDA